MGQPETIPQYFLDAVQRYGDRKVAIRQKRFGIWQESTWRESYEQVRDLALGLVELGLKRGDRVAIIGDNDREYLWADLAVLSAGGVAVGIWTDATPNEIEYFITHTDAAIVMAKDQEQCDKLLEVRKRLSFVKRVIYWDDKGMWSYAEPCLKDYKEVQAIGRRIAERDPGRFERMVAQGKEDEVAVFIHTSGTTGRPKAVPLTHKYLIFVKRQIYSIDPRYATDNHVSFLSFAWTPEHLFGVTAHVTDHVTMNFPESPETLQQDIREIAPQELMYNNRLWENLVRTVQMRINDSTWWNRTLYRLFLPVGYAVADRIFEKKPIEPWLRLGYALGNVLLFAPLRDQLGLSRLRTAFTGGAALSPDVVRFFRALGINLKQIYAITETGALAMHRDDNINFYSVGELVPGTEVQISSEGEILSTSPVLFPGYHKDEAATRKAIYIDPQGRRWFRTGDAGRLDENGHLFYFDRLDDMMELAGGHKYSPQYIEGHLKFNPAIRDVMAVGGEDHEYVAAIITIDFENVGRWAEKHRVPYTTYADLSQKPEVYDLLRQQVERVNQALPPPARVKRFISLPKEFDADEGEMTRTRKLRRRFLQERYRNLIEAIYNGADAVTVSAPVQYRDGRIGVVETRVRIVTLETGVSLPAPAANPLMEGVPV